MLDRFGNVPAQAQCNQGFHSRTIWLLRSDEHPLVDVRLGFFVALHDEKRVRKIEKIGAAARVQIDRELEIRKRLVPQAEAALNRREKYRRIRIAWPHTLRGFEFPDRRVIVSIAMIEIDAVRDMNFRKICIE